MISLRVFADGLPAIRGRPREARQREHVRLVAVAEVGDRLVPDLARAREAGDEDHRAALAADLDRERAGLKSGASTNGPP